MIRYDLECAEGHQFDSWFQDSATFDKHQKRGRIQCPICGSDKVAKALMTPSVPSKSNRIVEPSVEPGDLRAKAVRETLTRLRRHVEETAENVGDKFAEEARRIHYKEVKERGIYGEATLADAKELHDEGIDILPLPPSPEDLN